MTNSRTSLLGSAPPRRCSSRCGRPGEGEDSEGKEATCLVWFRTNQQIKMCSGSCGRWLMQPGSNIYIISTGSLMPRPHHSTDLSGVDCFLQRIFLPPITLQKTQFVGCNTGNSWLHDDTVLFWHEN